MREILFRGKRIDNDEWTEGFMVICDDRYFILSKTKINCLNPEWLKKGEYAFCCFIEVDPETVGQSTGLTTNGKKIFEGDICKVLSNYAVDKCLSAIVTVNAGDYGMMLFLCYADEIEIIGNIHDNPELLEGEEKCD